MYSLRQKSALVRDMKECSTQSNSRHSLRFIKPEVMVQEKVMSLMDPVVLNGFYLIVTQLHRMKNHLATSHKQEIFTLQKKESDPGLDCNYYRKAFESSGRDFDLKLVEEREKFILYPSRSSGWTKN